MVERDNRQKLSSVQYADKDCIASLCGCRPAEGGKGTKELVKFNVKEGVPGYRYSVGVVEGGHPWMEVFTMDTI
eukprot:gene1648-4780_t